MITSAGTKFLNGVSLFVLAAIISVAGVYLVFDFYTDSLSREVMNSWLQTEAVGIQENNLLSEITKNERVLLSSQFIRGVAVFDMSVNPPQALIEIGAKIPPRPEFLSVTEGRIRVFGNRFLEKHAVYKIPSGPRLTLIFDVESPFLQKFFFAFAFALLGLLIALFLSIKAVQRGEFLRREKYLRHALSDLVDSDQPSQFVKDELPFVVKWWEQKRSESDAARRIAVENESKILLGELAAQVAHDIGTPISALQQIIAASGDQAHHRELINDELERMKSLMDKMLRRYRGEAEPANAEQFELRPLLSTVVFEANALATGRCEIVADMGSEKIFIYGIKSDLSSALSNLLKNAIESIARQPGRVALSVKQAAGGLVGITITDTGVGIPSENLAKVFERGVTYKHGGSGLGLFQAKAAIMAMNGSIDFASIVGEGTTVVIVLPIAKKETPLLVDVGPETHLVFVDDEKIIHELWRKVLPPEVSEWSVHFFLSAMDFRSWMVTNGSAKSVFFIDHDLSKDGGETGIQLMEEFRISQDSFLVTGRALEESIQKTAHDRGVRLLGKADIRSVEFRVLKSTQMVLIDDARANRIAWSLQAQCAGCAIETFASEAEFFEVAARFDRGTPIYVDYFFEGVPRGTSIAEQIVRAGFTSVFIATSYPKEKISLPNGVRGIVGKDFPAMKSLGVPKKGATTA